jgi:hypothetical protein
VTPHFEGVIQTIQRKAINLVGADGGGNVKEDPQKAQNHNVHGQGCILLLEDKSGMFTAMRRNRKKDKSDDGSKDDDDAKSMDSIDDAKSVDSMDDAKSVDDIEDSSHYQPSCYATLRSPGGYRNY